VRLTLQFKCSLIAGHGSYFWLTEKPERVDKMSGCNFRKSSKLLLELVVNAFVVEEVDILRSECMCWILFFPMDYLRMGADESLAFPIFRLQRNQKHFSLLGLRS
jgi:hypothetical protein